MEISIGRLIDLHHGTPQRRYAGDREVLVVRQGDDVRVLPAECPHYHGPLPDGLVHDGRVVCPWHQSIFALRDGELLDPPSFFALPSWPVRIDDGEVWVEIPEEAPSQRTPAMTPTNPAADRRLAVLIGAGGAAALAAETLRQEGYAGRIVMVAPEDRLPYDRPNCTKDLLAGTLRPAWMPLRSQKFYEKWGIERLCDTVTALHLPRRTVDLASGQTLEPDLVLVASGATARPLPAPGADLEGVFTLRGWDDCEAIIAACQSAHRVVVAGASFVSLEAAASLRRRGLSVTIVAPERVPLRHVFGDRIGASLRALHEQNGVEFRLEQGITEVLGDQRVRQVRLAGGETLAADLVIAGIGVRPATQFLPAAAVDEDGGVTVDELLTIPDYEGVWAAGDIARYPAVHLDGKTVRIEHWRTALQHGRAAARAMMGHGEPFGGVPFFWTEHYGLRIGYVGYGLPWDEVLVNGDPHAGDFIAFYVHGQRAYAAAGTRDRQLAAFSELMRCGRLVSREELHTQSATDLVDLLPRR